MRPYVSLPLLLFRFASNKYANDTKSVGDVYTHLTNYSINKTLLPLLGPGAYYALAGLVQQSYNSMPVHIKSPRYASVGQKAKLIMSLDKKEYFGLNECYKSSIIADDANICDLDPERLSSEPTEPVSADSSTGVTDPPSSQPMIKIRSDL